MAMVHGVRHRERSVRHGYTRRAKMKLSLAAAGAAGIGRLLPGQAAAQAPTPAAGGTKIIGDVLDFVLKSDRWRGRFGFVTFRLHAGLFNGERAFFIRTDASDANFARDIGAVFVPKLEKALAAAEPATADIFLFDTTAAAGQLPVLSSVPNQPDFSPAFRVHNVTWRGPAQMLIAADAVRRAADDGQLTIEARNVVVNYPVVKWPGGELPADEAKIEYLGGGQLIEPVNTSAMTVTFKLHECYPSSWYIVADTSAVPMAPMMKVGASAASQNLTEAGATGNVYVLGNGFKGSGPMDGQPSVFDSVATTPAWSPFWDHFTLVWRNGIQPGLLRTEQDILPATEGGRVQLFNGVPESHPMGFVVNCPVPVIAPNDYVPMAGDGRSLQDEPPAVRALFRLVWGERDVEQWAFEHAAELARHR